MVKLMNSAMMPVPGTYTARKISPEEAREIVKRYGEKVESFVGYPETARYMSIVLGVDVPVNRAETTLESGDEIIVCKLKYRLKNPAEKGNFVPSDDDYEWWHVMYRAE